MSIDYCFAQATIREATSCSRWVVIQRPTSRQCAKCRGLGMLSPKWDVFIEPIPSGFREIARREGGKIVIVKEDAGHLGNHVFQIQ